MKIIKKYIYQVLIIFLLALLIFGYSLNKKSSSSKKNEISIFANQLKARNAQIAIIQKNLSDNGNDINDLINKNEINFKKVFENKKLINFFNYNFSKYTTNDILFNGNLGAIGTAYIDFYNKEKNIFLATYDGIFASSKINDLELSLIHI